MGFQDTFNERVIQAADRAFGNSVTLTQGDDTSNPFTAQWEKRSYDVNNSEGFFTSVESRDFMFAKVDCATDTAVLTPQTGGRISMVENDSIVAYEILPLGNMQSVSEMDGGFRWLVHTKRVQ